MSDPIQVAELAEKTARINAQTLKNKLAPSNKPQDHLIVNLESVKDTQSILKTFQQVAEKIGFHAQIHFDILELVNSELQTRPTFRQTIDNFRLNIPRIKEALLQERMSLDREALPEGNIVQQVSDRYFQKDKSFLAVDGVISKDPHKCELFVDTHYIDYMLSNVSQESQFLFEDLRRKVGENTENIKKLLDSHEREFKWIQTQMIRTSQLSQRTDQLLTRTLLNRFAYLKKQQLYCSWKKYISQQKHRRLRIKHMVTVFSKYHAAQALEKMKKRVRQMRAWEDKEKVDGAYLRIDQLNLQLKGFDKALERMHKEKANKHDFEFLKVSVDPNRAKTIFNDMKELFDSSMLEYKHLLEKEKEKMREAFQYIVSETQEKCDKRDLSTMQHKIDLMEKQMNHLTLENSKLKERIGIQRFEFSINRQSDQLAFQKQKLENLEIVNDDLNQKVDYFISLVQNSSAWLNTNQQQDAVVPMTDMQYLNVGHNPWKRRQSSAEELSENQYLAGSNFSQKNSFQTLQQRADYRPKTSTWGTARRQPAALRKNAYSNLQSMRGIQSAKQRRAHSTIGIDTTLPAQQQQSDMLNFFITATPMHNDYTTAATTCKALPASSKQFHIKESKSALSQHRQVTMIKIQSPKEDLDAIDDVKVTQDLSIGEKLNQSSFYHKPQYQPKNFEDLKIDLKNQDTSQQKLTYSLNPQLNKRLKAKKIEDLRKQAVSNVKKSLTMLDQEGRSLQAKRSASFRGEDAVGAVVQKIDQRYRRKGSRTKGFMSSERLAFHTNVLMQGGDQPEYNL